MPAFNSKQHRRSEAWYQTDAERQIDIAVLGGESVGKTALVNQFLYRSFPRKHNRTVDDDRWVLYENLETKEKYFLNIIDTSGSNEFIAMRNLYTSRADGILLVYAVNDAASFETLKRLREEVLNNNHKNAPVIIVGNKIDLIDEDRHGSRPVSKHMAEEYADLSGCHYMEVSAKDRSGAEEIFRQLLSRSQLSMPSLERLKLRRQSEPVLDVQNQKSKKRLPSVEEAKETSATTTKGSGKTHVKEERSHSCAIQ